MHCSTAAFRAACCSLSRLGLIQNVALMACWGFRQCLGQQVVTVAVVALVADVVIDLVKVTLRRHAGIEQDKGVRRSGAAWCVVAEIDTVRPEPDVRRDHGAIDGIDIGNHPAP